ncbi:MAG: nuclear transport factor 2 family protein [Piscinibacter sp.]|nr:nuclear transport factor 2 family protein [Piscinibacter sp.]
MTPPTPPRHPDPRATRLVAFFEALSPSDLVRLPRYYAADARFKDPFNEVQGVGAVQQVFAHMFEALDEPRFIVRDILVQGDQCFLTWDFVFRMRRHVRGEQVVRGASHLHFDAQGLVLMHRDYWDAAEELYEKLPALGALMRWLKRRARG